MGAPASFLDVLRARGSVRPKKHELGVSSSNPKTNKNKNEIKTNMTYSSTLTMNRPRTSVRGSNTVSLRSTDRRLGPVSNTVALIVLACVLGLLYLTQVTKTNAFGYTIDSLQKEQAALRVEHDDLEVASARLQSVERVQSSSVTAGMVNTPPSASLQ